MPNLGRKHSRKVIIRLILKPLRLHKVDTCLVIPSQALSPEARSLSAGSSGHQHGTQAKQLGHQRLDLPMLSADQWRERGPRREGPVVLGTDGLQIRSGRHCLESTHESREAQRSALGVDATTAIQSLAATFKVVTNALGTHPGCTSCFRRARSVRSRCSHPCDSCFFKVFHWIFTGSSWKVCSQQHLQHLLLAFCRS